MKHDKKRMKFEMQASEGVLILQSITVKNILLSCTASWGNFLQDVACIFILLIQRALPHLIQKRVKRLEFSWTQLTAQFSVVKYCWNAHPQQSSKWSCFLSLLSSGMQNTQHTNLWPTHHQKFSKIEMTSILECQKSQLSCTTKQVPRSCTKKIKSTTKQLKPQTRHSYVKSQVTK